MRRYRAVLFQVALVLVAGAFAVLTFLVKTMPSFAIDLQITRAIQLINFPSFSILMGCDKLAGFWSTVNDHHGLIILLIYGFGLHWEAVMALIAAVLFHSDQCVGKGSDPASASNIQLGECIYPLTSYSFPSGHVMFYLGFFGFIWFLAFSLLKPSLKRSLLLVYLWRPGSFDRCLAHLPGRTLGQ